MVCERLTDEQRAEVERWHPYAMKCAMNWSERYGRLADCDDFKSAGNDALIRAVRGFKPELGSLTAYFSVLMREEVGRLIRQIFGGGLVGSSLARSVKSTRCVPLARMSIDDIDPLVMDGDDFELLEIEDAFGHLSETHKRYLNASMDGVTGKQLGEMRGRTASNENYHIGRARAAFAQLMGVA